jgi:hypothetical protein
MLLEKYSNGGYLEMTPKQKKYWKALKCPVCGKRATFFLTKDIVKDTTKFPVPFEVIHEDHSFTIYLDSGLLISRIESSSSKSSDK